jgi:4-amino-4-deoxy-L-arabinose transferase-like glycosyltransferase
LVGVIKRNWLLFFAAFAVIFFMLGGKELWTQEIRWANICQQMLVRHDFLHPFLFNHEYYDKPLLSYWLILGFSYLLGTLNAIALRLPSAIAGLAVIWSVYYLGSKLISEQVGRIAAWLLVATDFFVFWSRVASTDMLNVAGIMLAVVWYAAKKGKPSFFNYAVFFLIVSLASLCKGPIAAVLTFIAILPDLFANNNWRKHLRCSFFAAMIPALCVYLAPFIISSYFNAAGYQESGLWEVFNENVTRFFAPFDHKGPIYTYFVYLPVYLLPWSPFFLIAAFAALKRWKFLPANTRWLWWSTLLIFIFLTVSGSRRSYYVLPLIPFAILITAEWMVYQTQKNHKFKVLIKWLIASFVLVNFVVFCVIYPFAARNGAKAFAKNIKFETEKIAPWADWHIVMVKFGGSGKCAVTSFYLNSPNIIQYQNEISPAPASQNIILLLPESKLLELNRQAKNYEILHMQKQTKSACVALIPKK